MVHYFQSMYQSICKYYSFDAGRKDKVDIIIREAGSVESEYEDEDYN